MKIIFLGAGTIIPDVSVSDLRSYSSILIEIYNEKLLFDIGPGTLSKMQNLRINTQKFPDFLFITHFHIDHCLDYIPLVKSRCFHPKISNLAIGKKLNVFGPPGLKQWNKDIFQKVIKWNYMSSELNYRKVTSLSEVKNGNVLTKKNWKITCCPIDHDNGIAYRLDSKGKSFVYSGDMGYDENLCELGKNADLVAIECSFPNKKSLTGKHLEPELIGNLAKIGNFKTIILTHLYPIVNGKEKSIIKKIQNIADCKVLIANDMKTMKL
jgi:ribonuclease BN (tRNA processing enzyme)